MEPSPSPSSTSASTAAPTVKGGGGGGVDGGVCEQAKLFVGGIPWEATEATLRDYFGKYGDVVDTVIMRDRGTGNARGFGFVSFADPSSADRAILDDAAVKHAILGRTVEVKRAIPRGNQHHQYYNDYHHQNRGLNKGGGRSMDGDQSRAKKIFVGGLSANLTQEEFKSYFEKFGKVTDVVVMYDSATNRPRGFGFITFDAEESVEKAVKNAFHTLNGKTVEVKRAVPREGSNNTANHNKNSDNWSSNQRTGNGKGFNFDSYTGGVYPPYSPRIGAFQGYGAHPYVPYTYWAGGFAGGYCFGGYRVNYGAPFSSSWNPWSGPVFAGSRQSPVPYGDTVFYPGYYNGGSNPHISTGVGGSHGSANRKLNQDDSDSQAQAVNNIAPSQVEDNGRYSSDC